MTAGMSAQRPLPPEWRGADPDDLLLSAKITRPELPRWFVPRPRLDRHIADGARYPLTVVTGPPGAGKTIAIASWASTSPEPIAWFSLDDFDNQSRLFWSYVVQALQRAGLAVPRNLWAPIGGRTGYDALTVRLAGALAGHGRPVFLVLDDLHLATGHRVTEALDRLLRNGYPNLRIVAASRSDPLLPLHRYRLAGDLTEIRADELQFRPAEARMLLRQHGVSLTARSQQSLTRQTEGWAAPLRLAAISMQDRPDPEGFVSEIAAEDSPVPAYLVEEVLNVQPAEVRDLMMRTSVLDRVSIGIAGELCGDETARTALPALARANAFVQPLGHGWYRYHPLLTEVMRLKFRRESPRQVAETRRQAARWLHRHGCHREAVTQAAAAADWPLAARIVVDELAVGRLISPPGDDPLAGAMQDIPRGPAWTEAHPWLAQAAVDLSLGRRDTAAAALVAAERVLRQRPAGHPARLAAALLRLSLLSRAGQWPSAAAAAEQAQALLAGLPDDLRARHPDVRVRLLADGGAAQLWAGRFDDAATTLGAAVAAADHGQRARVLEYLALAEALRGRLTHAARLAGEACALASSDPAAIDPRPCPAALITLAYVHTERNELRDAHARLKQLSAALRNRPDPMVGALAALVAAHVFLAEGRGRAALDIADRARRRPPSCGWLGRELILAQSAAYAAIGDSCGAVDAARRAGAGRSLDATAALARAALARGDTRAAEDALAGWSVDVPARVPDRMRIEACLAESRLGYGLGDRATGRRTFEQALSLAEAEQVRLPFVLDRAWIQGALQADPGLARAYRRQLEPEAGPGHTAPPTAITAARSHTAGPPPDGPNGPNGPGGPGGAGGPDGPLLLENLSQREREVLQCAAQLLDTTEIAAELFISVNTVKSHFKSIFRKLGATSRNEAVRRARKLELI